MTPIEQALQRKCPLILDGGLATELEQRGYDLHDPLWSAKVLIEEPQAIEQLHLDYLAAGADILITSSYQASFSGLARRGIDEANAMKLFRTSVQLAQQARDRFWEQQSGSEARARPLVAASIGPYGAALADGSEFRGDYGISQSVLRDFHERRLKHLVSCGSDLLACESIPLLEEARVLAEILRNIPDAWAWVSFTCRDETHLSSGEPLAEAAAFLDRVPNVLAIGVNCTDPRLIFPLIGAIRSASAKPIVIYPNSGETWNAESRSWCGVGDPQQFATLAHQWYEAGASLIGGCCRTGPAHIRALADQFAQS